MDVHQPDEPARGNHTLQRLGGQKCVFDRHFERDRLLLEAADQEPIQRPIDGGAGEKQADQDQAQGRRQHADAYGEHGYWALRSE